MEPKVSIIIPVYNVEQYLDECLLKVLNQTYENLEVIVVDDGSTDGSGEKCDGYVNRDSRISVYHKQNGGLSDARNYGIEKATGEFLFFLDSDDFIDTYLIEGLVCTAIKDNADIVVNDAVDYFDGDVISANQKQCSSEALDSLEAVKKALMTRGIRHMAWGKLFRSTLWKTRRFSTGILYEDLDVIYDVMLDAKVISVLYPSLYYYRQRAGSIMNSKVVTEKNVRLFYTAEKVCKEICDKYPIIAKEAKRMEVVNDMKLLQSILDYDGSSFLEIQIKIQAKAREYCWELLPILSFKDKVKIISLSINKTLFHKIYSLSR